MKRLTLRLPYDLHAELAEDAAKNRRSLNAQILWLLERGLEKSASGTSN